MTDGARNARLYEKRTVCCADGFSMRLVRGENCGFVDVLELVDASADDPADVLADEDLVLRVGAPLGAVVGGGSNRQVEEVLPEIAAVGQHVVSADVLHVADSKSNVLLLKSNPSCWPVRTEGEQVRGAPVEDVREEVGLERALAEIDLAVAEHGAAVDVERPDPAVQDAVGPGDAALEHQALAVLEVTVHPQIELRLRGPGVRERADTSCPCRSAAGPSGAAAGPA